MDDENSTDSHEDYEGQSFLEENLVVNQIEEMRVVEDQKSEEAKRNEGSKYSKQSGTSDDPYDIKFTK